MKPIVVVGGGVAGLAACWWLRARRIPHLMIHAAAAPGGRFGTIRSADWTADPWTPFVLKSDRTIFAIAREFGLDTELATIQDAILTMSDSGPQRSAPGDYRQARVCLRNGMDTLFAEAAKELEIHGNVTVDGVRWSDGAFVLRDAATGHSVRHPVSRRTIGAGGVVLAVDGPSALRIARNSALLEPAVDQLAAIEYAPEVVALFKVPRMDPGFYALERHASPDLKWIGFEERKVPSRVGTEWSLMVVHAGETMSAELLDAEEGAVLERLFDAARKRVPDLPLGWNEAKLVRSGRSRARNPCGDLQDDRMTNPAGAPVALAGDFIEGDRAEDAARSGARAAALVVQRTKTGGVA